MSKYNQKLIKYLEDKAYEIRKLTIRLMSAGHLGHPGGAMSEADLLAALYFRELNIDPENPQWEDRDRFIISKAHTCNALYAALALRGFYPVGECMTYGCIGSRLQGHTDMRKTPGIEISGGSLGQGLSVAAGMAWSAKKLGKFNHIFCLIGDGETQEGQIWEAVMSASQYKLDNLTAIMDYNKVQAKDYTHNEIGIEPVKTRWEAFGWLTLEINGHDFEDILNALYKARWFNRIGKPTIIIAHTIKGKGIPWMEFNSKWHTHAPTGEKAEKAIEELSKTYGKPYVKGEMK